MSYRHPALRDSDPGASAVLTTYRRYLIAKIRRNEQSAKYLGNYFCFRDAAYPFPTVGRLLVAFRAELKDNFFECKKKFASKNYSVSARRIFLKVAQIPQITRILIRQRIMACAVTYHLRSFSLEKKNLCNLCARPQVACYRRDARNLCDLIKQSFCANS